MSILYPRLLDRVAREMHEEYRSLDIAELTARAALRHPASVFAATGGRQVTTSELRTLREGLLSCARHNAFPQSPSRTARAEFDLAVARLLHERTDLVAAEAANRDTWTFLALVVAPDVAYWRYQRPPAERILSIDITRHVFGRLWWRAHLLALPEPTRDRYALLDSFGEAAFDQIFARRRAIGSSPALVRALARRWPQHDVAGLNERDVLRNTLMRLVRLEAVLCFDALDDDDLDDLVIETLADTTSHATQGNERRREHRHAHSGTTAGSGQLQ